MSGHLQARTWVDDRTFLPSVVAKVALVDCLSRLPTLRLQRIAGEIVRRVWRGFPAA
jgi:hypothetical protein